MLQYGNKKEISTNWKKEHTAVLVLVERTQFMKFIFTTSFTFLSFYHYFFHFFSYYFFHYFFHYFFITFSASQTPGLTLPEDLLALLAEEGAKKKKRSKAKGKKVATETA